MPLPSKLKKKEALERIASHFENCDLTGDDAALFAVQVACRALGWEIIYDANNEITYAKPKAKVKKK
jgi:hypothetical protein